MSSAAMARGTSGTNPTRVTWSSSPSARISPRGPGPGPLVPLHHAKPAHQPHQQPVARDPEIAAQWTAIETGVELFGVDATGEGDDPLPRPGPRRGGLAPG